MIGVTPREWVGAFYFVVGVAVVAIFGFRLFTALISLSIILMVMIANKACASDEFSYWKGMQVVASLN